MGASTKIQWCDATWNPTEGCTMAKGSETGGCLNCYAARAAVRRPEAGLAVMRPSGPRWLGKVRLVEKRLTIPLHWREPRRIFVNSMSDLFHEALEDFQIARVFAVMALAHWHTFQVLTKRQNRMLALLTDPDFLGMIADFISEIAMERTDPNNRRSDDLRATAPDIEDRESGSWPLPNVWLGVSVENQKTADERIPILLKTPAALRF